ncbi:MAG: Hpt domain-containing protein [Phycisphaerales bacterium]
MQEQNKGPGGDAICSQYANDPDMVEIVELFVRELPKRLCSLREAFEQDNHDSLRTLSHQLKGSAPGYGFPSIGRLAGRLEATLREPDASQDAVRGQLEDLIALCERARVS